MSKFNRNHDEKDYEELSHTDRDDRWDVVRTSAKEAIRHAGSRGNKRPRNRIMALMDRPLVLIGAVVAGLFILVVVFYLLFGSSNQPSRTTGTAQAPERSAPQGTSQGPAQETPQGAPQGRQAPSEDDSFIGRIFGSEKGIPGQPLAEGWLKMSARILLRLALAALLAALLAYRPRKDLPVPQRNPYVAQTQILLAVVASALMMIVSDNAARAFGIFAAASLVRFRTTVRDPKEITVLLISLGIGLATGVGFWSIAIILALFVMLMLWVLEYYEPEQILRAMELTVKTRDVEMTDDGLKEIFEKHEIQAELRKVDHPDEEDEMGTVRYRVNVSPLLSTDELSDEIMSSDPHNIDSIQWNQKKSTAYIYK